MNLFGSGYAGLSPMRHPGPFHDGVRDFERLPHLDTQSTNQPSELLPDERQTLRNPVPPLSIRPLMHPEVPCATVRDAGQCSLHDYFARIGKPSLTESAPIHGKLLDTYEVVYTKWSLWRAGVAHPLVFRLGS